MLKTFKIETISEVIKKYFDEKSFTKKTELCDLMNKLGSDKGSGHHNYTSLYHALFEPIRETTKHVFEVGLGTHNTNIPSHMGLDTTPCSSIRGWRDYFQNAKVYGADIDREILITEDRIQTFYCDQTDVQSITAMWASIPDDLDIIIDDGLHEFYANKVFYENSIHKLRDGGIYIVEDVKTTLAKEYAEYFSVENKSKKFGVGFVVMIPNPHNTGDNNLVIIQK